MKTTEPKLEGWVRELDEYLKTYEGNKDDFCNGVRWFASRDDNPIVKRALEMMLAQEEKALADYGTLEEEINKAAERIG